MRHHETRMAFLACLLILGPVPIDGLAAQATQTAASGDTTPQWTVGATYFRAGTASLGLGQLNADLVRNGRPTFSNRVFTLGISTHARLGRLLYGASIEQSLPHRALENDWVTKLAANGASLDAGLALVQASNTLVYSTVSLGIRSTSLHFERRGDFTYSEGLQDPARALDLSSRTGLAITSFKYVAARTTCRSESSQPNSPWGRTAGMARGSGADLWYCTPSPPLAAGRTARIALTVSSATSPSVAFRRCRRHRVEPQPPI